MTLQYSTTHSTILTSVSHRLMLCKWSSWNKAHTFHILTELGEQFECEWRTDPLWELTLKHQHTNSSQDSVQKHSQTRHGWQDGLLKWHEGYGLPSVGGLLSFKARILPWWQSTKEHFGERATKFCSKYFHYIFSYLLPVCIFTRPLLYELCLSEFYLLPGPWIVFWYFLYWVISMFYILYNYSIVFS